MKLLKEVLARVRRLDPEDGMDDVPFGDESSSTDQDGMDDVPFDDLNTPDEEGVAADQDVADDVPFDDLDAPEQDGEDHTHFGDPDDEHPELDGIADDAAEDPDRQGLIRTVKNAHLVYKRETEDGTYEELWVYNVSNMRDELEAKKAILAGTDIPTNKMRSPDGTQTYEIWAAGNAEMILVKGLPN